MPFACRTRRSCWVRMGRLQLSESRGVLEPVHHTLHYLDAISIPSGPADLPFLIGVQRSTLALGCRRREPASLPTNNDLQIRFGAFEVDHDTLHVVVFVKV